MKRSLIFSLLFLLIIPNISLATNDTDNSCDDSLDTPVVEADINSDSIVLSWNKIDHYDLDGYKVVISREDASPVYPSNGYLVWLTDRNTTSHTIDNSSAYHSGDFGSYLEEGEDYYFSITAVYGCGTKIAGNVLHLTYPGNSNSGDDSSDNDSTENDNDNEVSSPIYPATVVSASSSEDGILLTWEEINHAKFTGYKVVVAKDKENPKYPDHGYARYITNPNTTSFLLNNGSEYIRGNFGGYLKVGEDYNLSITTLYGNERVAGNAVEAVYSGPSHQAKVKLYNDDSLTIMKKKAQQLLRNDLGDILSELQELRDIVKEQATEIKYLHSLMSDMQNITQSVKDTLNQFITYGVDENTKKLGAGERAAVIHSFKSAFNKLPETEDEVADAIKIANGRWPSQTSEAGEARSKLEFKKIYLRDANMNQPNDNAAITVMTYGLRQKAENRNLDSEREGIKTFKYIYGYTPASTEDWNTMQAITYSGAIR